MSETTKLIVVQGAEPGTVGLWERDERHPDGEIFVTGDAPVEVYPTMEVRRRLQRGLLVEVGAAEAEADEPAADSVTDVFGEKVGGLLLEAGYSTADVVAAANDADLLAIDGIGKATLAEIRESAPPLSSPHEGEG